MGNHCFGLLGFKASKNHRIRIRISALLSTERLQTHVFTMITKIFVQ